MTNDTAALQNLAVTQTTVTWTRGGSSPQFTRVTFEYSTDNVNYTPLGNGTAAGSSWTLTGLNLLDRTELLHPRSRLLSQRLEQRLGEHRGISAECFSWADRQLRLQLQRRPPPPPPRIPHRSRSQIRTTTINVTSNQSGTVVTTPLVATVPAGNERAGDGTLHA